MSESRLLHEEGLTRFVELSHFFDTYAPVPVQQTIARLQHSYYERERCITLQCPDDEESSRVKTFVLSFEEMNALIGAYQAFLADYEERFSSPSASAALGGDDDFPF